MIKLLLVEDDESLAYIEKTGLEDIIGGYEVVTATNGKEGVKAWEEHRPDVIISDIDMPVMNGFEMVERIRETDQGVIIIFTSALTSPNDVKAGYRLGINNYVKKPFVPEELDAHIQALMKMRGGTRTEKQTSHYKLGKYTLDAGHATLRNDDTGEAKTITQREAQILQLLADNKNNVVRREAILSRFWNTEDDYFASRSLDVFVNKLRKLLSDEPRVTLKTVRGIGLQLLVAASLLLLFLLPTPLAAQNAQTQSAQAQKDHYFEVGKHLDIFNQVYKNLELLYVDTLNPKETIGTAINAMLSSLDPYTEYYAQENAKDLRMMLTGKYAGIGALIRKHQKLGRVVIDEPYAGMPAAEAGLRKGDVILSIDDSLMTNKEVSYVSEHLRGEPGTSFLLKVFRPSAQKEMKFKITRKNIKLPELPYYGMRPGNIGYINFNSFTQESAKEVRRAFVDLKKRGATSLIFDLRSNGGGSESEAVDIVNLWIPKDITVVENRGKLKEASKAYKTRLEPVDTVMPVVVLVNGETASASEITSGALQDLDRAVVLGTRTYGKGLVQVPIDLPYNTNLKVTTSKYYIPSGRCIQAINYKHSGGGYREHIPDSLTKVFYTRAGREVRDGGGIKPDVEVKADTIPNIAFYLSASGQDSTEVMFDYVCDYITRHPQIAAPAEFHLTDDDWEEFKARVIQSGFTYDPVSRKQFDQLVKTAKFEGYYDEAKAAFDTLQSKLRHNVAFDLEKNRKVLQQVIESDIISAYYYQAGAIEAGLNYDRQLKEAERLLSNPGEYRRLLTPRKPE